MLRTCVDILERPVEIIRLSFEDVHIAAGHARDWPIPTVANPPVEMPRVEALKVSI